MCKHEHGIVCTTSKGKRQNRQVPRKECYPLVPGGPTINEAGVVLSVRLVFLPKDIHIILHTPICFNDFTNDPSYEFVLRKVCCDKSERHYSDKLFPTFNGHCYDSV